MFVERLAALPQELLDFSIGWQASDRDAWRSLPDTHRTRLRQAAREMTQDPWPILTDDAYQEFSKNGNRVRFEKPYMIRRRMLNAFVMAECADVTGLYIDQIIEGIQLLCDEAGWQLPAHNTYIRDTPCLPLPDPDRPVVDLFSSETAAQLAVLYHLLSPQLDDTNPQITQTILNELHDRIITPYLNVHFWWMGHGDEPMNNWTTWCTQNVLLVAFLTPCSKEIRRAIVQKAAASLDYFLKDYGEDGACEEGVVYYRHAGLCLFNALDVLSRVAPDAFMPLWQNPKIRNIADFIALMHVEGDRYFNFADASARTGHCSAREVLFGQAVGSKLLEEFALNDWKQEPRPDMPREISLYYRLQSAQTIAARQVEFLQPPVARKISIPDHYFPSIGLLVARDEQFSLAVKAGDNGDSHNHNDVGSVILYKNGQPILIDVGVEIYTGQTFSGGRYDLWSIQSNYHNLPSFRGIGQMAGESFAARDVHVQLDEKRVGIKMELSGAYPPEANVESYHRSVFLNKDQNIEIIDTHKSGDDTVLSLMFAIKPVMSDGAITLPEVGSIQIEGAGPATIETIEITDARLLIAWPSELYRVLLPLQSHRLKLLIQ